MLVEQFVRSRAEGPARLLRPQSRQTACGLGTNPPPQKGTFKDSAHAKVLFALGGSF